MADAALRLPLVMRLRGVPEARLAAPAAAALQRCRECRMAGLCDEALAARDARAFALFCPNTHAIEQAKKRS